MLNETGELHSWVLSQHLETAGAPDAFMSDRHVSLIQAVRVTSPLSYHCFCLHHLDGNVCENLRSQLGNDWSAFKDGFWSLYRSVSPTEFTHRFESLVLR